MYRTKILPVGANIWFAKINKIFGYIFRASLPRTIFTKFNMQC